MNTPHENRAALIASRDFALPADHWYQIEVSGRWRNVLESTDQAGKRETVPVVELIDEEAIDAIVAAFNARRDQAGESWAGILIDPDHKAYDLAHETKAKGWLMEVSKRFAGGAAQLFGRIDWTATGEAEAKGGDWRFFSTVYRGDDLQWIDKDTVRPLALDGLAVTNRPNHRGGLPISLANMAKRPDGFSAPSRAGKEENTDKENMDTQILEALGLAEGASMEDALAAIADLKKKASDADDAKNEAEVEAIMSREEFAHAITGASREVIKSALLANRDATIAVLRTVPKVDDKAAIHNREKASTPTSADADDKEVKAESAKAAFIRNRVKELASIEPGLDFAGRWARAESEYDRARANA